MSGAQFGVIGLGTMGRNLALNIESRGVPVAVWNLETEWVDDFLRDHPGQAFTGTKTFEELAAALERPRRIMMMIPAGKPVDQTIEKIQPLLEAGRHPHRRRQLLVRRHAPPRGRAARRRASTSSAAACRAARKARATARRSCRADRTRRGNAIKDVLEAIAAKTEAGPVRHARRHRRRRPLRQDGPQRHRVRRHAAHRRGRGTCCAAGSALSAPETADVFDEWNRGRLESFLVELTARVCRVTDPETRQPLVDVVLDKAGQKGTGSWTAQVALDLGVAVPTIAAALDARGLSSLKDERVAASQAIARPAARARGSPARIARQVIDDLDARALRGAHLRVRAGHGADSRRRGEVRLEHRPRGDRRASGRAAASSARGCSIRCARPSKRSRRLVNLLLDPAIGDRRRVGAGAAGGGPSRRTAASGIPLPAHASALAYFDSYRTARLPQSLTQAQRDAFGAHTYERIDRPGAVHSEW